MGTTRAALQSMQARNAAKTKARRSTKKASAAKGMRTTSKKVAAKKPATRTRAATKATPKKKLVRLAKKVVEGAKELVAKSKGAKKLVAKAKGAKRLVAKAKEAITPKKASTEKAASTEKRPAAKDAPKKKAPENEAADAESDGSQTPFFEASREPVVGGANDRANHSKPDVAMQRHHLQALRSPERRHTMRGH